MFVATSAASDEMREREREREGMFGLLLLHLRLRGEGRGGHTWTGLDWKDYWFSSSDLQTQCNFKIFLKKKKINIFRNIVSSVCDR